MLGAVVAEREDGIRPIRPRQQRFQALPVVAIPREFAAREEVGFPSGLTRLLHGAGKAADHIAVKALHRLEIEIRGGVFEAVDHEQDAPVPEAKQVARAHAGAVFEIGKDALGLERLVDRAIIDESQGRECPAFFFGHFLELGQDALLDDHAGHALVEQAGQDLPGVPLRGGLAGIEDNGQGAGALEGADQDACFGLEHMAVGVKENGIGVGGPGRLRMPAGHKRPLALGAGQVALLDERTDGLPHRVPADAILGGKRMFGGDPSPLRERAVFDGFLENIHHLLVFRRHGQDSGHHALPGKVIKPVGLMKNPSGSRLLIVGLSYIFTGRDRKIIPPLQEGPGQTHLNSHKRVFL